MGATGLGLILGLGVDPSGADKALVEFATQSENSFSLATDGVKTMNAAGDELGKSVLTSRESVRLLAEEAGFHLPRAVSGAIAEMLPSIGSLSTAFLGVFAVEEVWHFGKEAVAMMHDLQGETKELKKDWDDVVAEQRKLLVDPHTKEDAIRNLNDTNKALSETTRLNAELKKQLDEVPVGAALLAAEISSQLSKEEERERQLQTLAAQQLNALTRFAEEERKEAKETARVVAKTEREKEEARRHAMKEQAEDNAFISAWLEKCQKQDDATLKIGVRAQLEAINYRTKAQKEFAAGLAQENAQLAASLSILPPTLKILGSELPNQLPKLREWAAVLHDLTHAQDAQNKGLAESTAFVAQNAASILDTLGAKREYSAVMAIYETAKGFEALGDWDFWGAGQDFASAAMYAKVAGTSEHKGGAGGGGGGRMRSQGRSSGWGDSSGGSQGVERGGAPSGGGSSAAGQTIVQISGGKLNSNGQQQLAAWVGMGSAVGLFKFTSSGSSGISASRY